MASKEIRVKGGNVQHIWGPAHRFTYNENKSAFILTVLGAMMSQMCWKNEDGFCADTEIQCNDIKHDSNL